jgi:NAD(P)-dependent dehydrogenase (short-subunit alcohol dehydrogenase family)
MGRLKDKVVVITGASSGIGRATALALASRGAGPLVLVARREAALGEVVDACQDAGGEAWAAPADITDADAVEQVAHQVIGRHGRIDAWINDAAVNAYGALDEVPVEAWHRVIETNVFGTYHGLRSVIPWMRAQGHGVIVNVASVLADLPAPMQSAYGASKHALRGLSDSARAELSDLPDVHVCTVLPGPIDTPIFGAAANYAGRAIAPLAPVIDAARVAEAIVGCLERPRPDVVVGLGGKGVLGLRRLIPGATKRAAARQVEEGHFQDRLVPPNDGNLFEPEPGTGSVSGGWSRRGEQVGRDSDRAVSNHGRSKAGRVLALAGLAGVAGAAVTARTRAG